MYKESQINVLSLVSPICRKCRTMIGSLCYPFWLLFSFTWPLFFMDSQLLKQRQFSVQVSWSRQGCKTDALLQLIITDVMQFQIICTNINGIKACWFQMQRKSCQCRCYICREDSHDYKAKLDPDDREYTSQNRFWSLVSISSKEQTENTFL